MNRHFSEGDWELLQEVGPTMKQKESIRSRLQKSIDNSSSASQRKGFFHWKALVATLLLFVIGGGFLFMQLEHQKDSASGSSNNQFQFSWDLENVIVEKSEDGWLLYLEGSTSPVGSAKEVSQEEMQKITNTFGMNFAKELDNFPYKTTMYIEHVKREVLIRYHFFITLSEEKIIHFSFNYPQIEHSDVFAAISSLELKGYDSYTHAEQLYVTHGYGNMIFPADLHPISISTFNEVYRWEGVSQEKYDAYMQEILEVQGNWNLESKEGNTHTFVSASGLEVVTISLKGEEISYEFYYPNREEL